VLLDTDAFKRRRCLMPASEFFEKGRYFQLPEYRTFAFAAAWESGEGRKGRSVAVRR
jgi:putative SOS response-associated peptidase YedK